jgi:nitrite reductase/ring-hydroxylating ferredoxin subunit
MASAVSTSTTATAPGADTAATATPHRQLTPAEPIVQQLESAELLDAAGKAVGGAVRSMTSSSRKLKDALSGTWLGHAVHPMLTDVVTGAFLSATLLDLVGGADTSDAAERLIAIGIVTYPPTAATGANDWADTEIADERVRRVGLVHAASNTLALSLYSASLTRRRRGKWGQGAILGAAGAAALLAGGYLGGHMSLRKGVGPDQTVFDPGPTDWTPAADPAQLPEGRPTRVVVDDTPVLLLRQGSNTFAIHDRCSHRGCSLSEGEVHADEIVCSCHGSRFSLRDGSVINGPATTAQPAFQVRESAGRLEVRRLQPGS